MSLIIFLIANLAVGFYCVGIVWANEIDIFRSWHYIRDVDDFQKVWHVHWRKLWYWGLIPIGMEFAGSIGLLIFHPDGSPLWAIWGNFTCQLLSLVLTVLFWEQWQAKLSRDPLGSQSPFLTKIFKTHWIRAMLTTTYAIILFVWVILLVP
jgi:hypothetical protein